MHPTRPNNPSHLKKLQNIVVNNLSSRIRQPQVQILASLSIICVILSNTLFSLNLTFLIGDMEIINVPVPCDDFVSISAYVFMELQRKSLDFLFSFPHPQTSAFRLLNFYWSFTIRLRCCLLSECCSVPTSTLPSSPIHSTELGMSSIMLP